MQLERATTGRGLPWDWGRRDGCAGDVSARTSPRLPESLIGPGARARALPAASVARRRATLCCRPFSALRVALRAPSRVLAACAGGFLRALSKRQYRKMSPPL